MNLSETGNFPLASKLIIEAQVIITSNINIDDRLINGMIGQVTYFFISNRHVKIGHLKFDDENIDRITMESALISRENQWIPISKQTLSFSIKKNRQPLIKHVPLVLPWACTIVKVQGLSLHCGALSFSLQLPKVFNQDQMYATLSRSRSLENMYLIEKFTA